MKASKKKFSTTSLTDSLKKEYALVDTELETAIKQLKLFAKGYLLDDQAYLLSGGYQLCFS
jgi:hypothetical protein